MNIIQIKDSTAVAPGDNVEIAVSGSSLLKASLLLYGVPLILMLAGIVIGSFVFSANSNFELLSCLVGLGLISGYIGMLLVNKKSLERLYQPKIIRVSKNI